MIGKIVRLDTHNGFAIETTLDPTAQPFLFDHQIDGTPVLPGVMGIEAFAEAASYLLPGWRVDALEDVNFLAPFKFYRHDPRALTVETAVHPEGDALIADCKLIGIRALPNQAEGQVATHFTARVRLTKQAPAMTTTTAIGTPNGRVIEAAAIYPLYFHGPAYQVLQRAWWDGHRMVGLMSANLGNNHHPAELPTVVPPRFIELCFQTVGLWEMGLQGRMGLPQQIGRVSILQPVDSTKDGLYAVVIPRSDEGSFDAEIVDTKGNCYLRLSRYRTVAVPNAVDTERLKILQSFMSGKALIAA